jgi:hypothetical protein
MELVGATYLKSRTAKLSGLPMMIYENLELAWNFNLELAPINETRLNQLGFLLAYNLEAALPLVDNWG